ncbi:MAG: MBL fold metallo-hydrolase [Dehalococcoidia bacterium]
MTTINIGGMRVEESQSGNVTEYAWQGLKIYRIPAHSYPGHATNMYLVLDDEVTLIDMALDTEGARSDLYNGLAVIKRVFGKDIAIEDISSVVITHGHADHWGMLANASFGNKRVYIHELDSDALKDYGNMRANARTRIASLIKEAGWSLSMDNLFSLDGLLAQPCFAQLVEIHEGEEIIDDYQVIHVPGHSPGQICLKVGPILFLGDHILSQTTPLQIPGSMRQGCGLRLYLDSLEKVGDLGEHLGLPAHEDTIYSVKNRVDEIRAFHYQRLLDILALCQREKNLFQITDEYYQLRPETINGKTLAQLPRDEQILALEEIKAHVEYLMEDGHIAITSSEDGVLMYRAI